MDERSLESNYAIAAPKARVLNMCLYLGFRADRIDRKKTSLKFFVLNTQQWCESHPLRHNYLIFNDL